MKRLITALAISSMAGFALPAMAAPKVVSKKQLTPPIVQPSVLKKYYGKTTITYSYRKKGETDYSKTNLVSPPLRTSLIVEKHCGNAEYKIWRIQLDFARITKSLNAEQGYNYQDLPSLIQLTHKGRNYWAQGFLNPIRADCFGERIRLMDMIPNVHSISPEQMKTGKLQPPVRISNTAMWNGAVIVEGVAQFPGSLQRGDQWTGKDNKQVDGDSTIFVLETDGTVKPMKPTWFLDFNAPRVDDLRPPFLPTSTILSALGATFYRLPDGYGVTEALYYDKASYAVCTEQGAACGEDIYPDFRVRDGQSTYELVPVFKPTPLPGGPIVNVDMQNGITYAPDSQFGKLYYGKTPSGSILVHGAPRKKVPYVTTPPREGEIRLGGSDIEIALDPNGPSGGWVIKETPTTATIRYLITPYGAKTQYWEAVIQK